MSEQTNPITIETSVNAPVAKVWTMWTTPAHVMNWNAASDDWHTTAASADFRIGGSFKSRMEAKDKSMGFDFGGTYTDIQNHALIAFKLGEGPAAREVRVVFEPVGDSTIVRETFTPEMTHPIEAQRNGWQSILNRFKNYVEQQP